MNTRSLMLFALASLALPGLEAQTAGQTTEAEFATRKDVTTAVTEMRSTVRGVEKKIAASNESIKNDIVTVGTEISDVKSQIAKSEAASLKALEAAEKERLASQKLLRAVVAACSAIIAACAIIAIWSRRKRTASDPPVSLTAPLRYEQREEPAPIQAERQGIEILRDPGITAIAEYARKHGTTDVPFIMTLHQEGREIACTARVVEGEDPKVLIPGHDKLVAWEKRKRIAAKLVATGQRAAA